MQSCLLNKGTQTHCLFCTTNHAHPAGRVDSDKYTNTGLAKQLSNLTCVVGVVQLAQQLHNTRRLGLWSLEGPLGVRTVRERNK